MIYLDNNASTQVLAEVAEVVVSAMTDVYANPASIHLAGSQANQLLVDSKQNISTFLSCSPDQIIFTSSGTESVNLALRTGLSSNRIVLSSPVEHSSTLNTLKSLFLKKHYLLPVNQDGQISLKEFIEIVQNNSIALVSLMAANNETGIIYQNLAEIIEICKKYNILFHLDAVQAVGKIDIHTYADVDFISLSGHKFHAPKGVAILYAKKPELVLPTIFGGGDKVRAGTSNLPGIAGIGKAIQLVSKMDSCLIDRLIDQIKVKIPAALLIGEGVMRVCNTTMLAFPGVHSQSLVQLMANKDVMVSRGSACANGIGPSHVLRAMQLDEKILHSCVRFSTSHLNSLAEIDEAVEYLQESYQLLKKLGGDLTK